MTSLSGRRSGFVQLGCWGRFGNNNGDGQLSHPLFLAFREQNTAFSGLTGQRIEQASLVDEERHEMVSVGLVAGKNFQVLGFRSPLASRASLLNPMRAFHRE